MIVFITTGYGQNVIGGADIWCNNFIENVLPEIKEDYKIIIDGRPLVREIGAIYTYENEKEVDRILNECDKIVFLHHSYKKNPIIQKYLHKTYLTFVHAFIPDMVGLNDEYENLMTRLDWHWQKDILDNSEKIVWIGYEDDTIHTYFPKTITIPNYYEWKSNRTFTGVLSNRIGYAARCETRKNAHYLDNIPSFIFSNKYDQCDTISDSIRAELDGYRSLIDSVDNIRELPTKDEIRFEIDYQIAEMENQALQPVDFTNINDLTKIAEHLKFLLDLLTSKDSFVRKRIIDQNLGYLNQRLAYYLDRVGLPHTVKFLNDLTVEISELGRELDFDNLSRGERNRLILSLSWAFRDVWESLYHPINLLLIDELIDSGMDSMGVENGIGVLKKLSRERDKSIFLISHRDELITRVNNVLTVTKENGFTTYSSDVTVNSV